MSLYSLATSPRQEQTSKGWNLHCSLSMVSLSLFMVIHLSRKYCINKWVKWSIVVVWLKLWLCWLVAEKIAEKKLLMDVCNGGFNLLDVRRSNLKLFFLIFLKIMGVGCMSIGWYIGCNGLVWFGSIFSQKNAGANFIGLVWFHWSDCLKVQLKKSIFWNVKISLELNKVWITDFLFNHWNLNSKFFESLKCN